MGANGRRRRSRRRRRSAAGPILGLILLAVVLLGAYIAMDRFEASRYREQRSVASEDFYQKTEVDAEGQTYRLKQDLKTVLVMGVDHPTQTEESVEMMMLLVMDHENKQIRWLHINRDTAVETPEGRMLLNDSQTAADESGKRNRERVDRVKALLGGVDIQYYIALDLKDIGALNRVLSGISVTLDEDFSAYDPAMTAGTTLTLSDAQAELLLDDGIVVGDGTERTLMKRQQAFVLGMFETLKGRVREDSDAMSEFLDQLGGVMDTNFYTAQMVNEFARAYAYGVPAVEMLPGEYRTDDQGVQVFQPDVDAIRAWTLDVFYREATDPAQDGAA